MSDPKLTARQQRVAIQLVERSALNDFPNPDRVGCPGTDFLRTLAFDRQSIHIGDTRINHLGECSPCFQEFVEFRRKAKSQMITRRLAVGSIAATILAGVGVAWHPKWKGPDDFRQDREELVELDLSSESTNRGAEASHSTAPTVKELPRKRLVLRVTLPFGSPSGDYEVKVLHADGRPIGIATSGHAKIEDGKTLLEVKTDMRSLVPDRYQIGIRRVPFDWLPVLVQVK